MKVYFTTIIYLIASINALCQNIKLASFVTKVQWTVFVTNDTIYNVTKYINQEGRFFFQRGFIDTSSIKKQQELYRVEKINRKKILKGYELKYEFIDNIDTIHSYYKRAIDYPDSANEIIINKVKYTEHRIEDVLLEDVAFSYIINVFIDSLYESSVYTIIPEDDLNFSHRYSLLKLDYLSSSQFNFFLYKGISKDSSGIQMIEKDSGFIPEKKLKRINENLSQIKGFENKHCLSPGNPWLLIFEDKNFLISDYCLREKRNKSLYQVSDAFHSLLFLRLKYFSKKKITILPFFPFVGYAYP